jgi:hypothetical protein
MQRAVAFAAFAAAAVVIGLAVGVLARGEGEEQAGAPVALARDPISVTSQVEPDGAFFGQPVVARLDVQLDATVVDPDRVRPEVDFAPYTAFGPSTVEHVRSGHISRITYHYPLRCLAEGCDPAADQGLVDFESGRVFYVYQGERRGRVLAEEVDWAPFVVTGRVGQNAVRDIRWRASSSSLAAVTYRAEPRTTATLLLALAVALAAVAAAVAWLQWGRRRREELDAETAEQTPLALVLAAARAAAGNGDVPKRRRALESVARELRRAGLVHLAVDARTLAWSPEEVTPDEVESLARRTELELEAGR